MASCNEMGIRGGVRPSALRRSRQLPAASGRTLARSPCWFSRQVVGVQRGVLLGGWGDALALSSTHTACPICGSQGHSEPDLHHGPPR